MTRKEILQFGRDTVNRIFHGHHKTVTMEGYITRDRHGSLTLWRHRPEKNLSYGCWVELFEDGRTIPDKLQLPSVKWEDEEPTPCKITIEIDK